MTTTVDTILELAHAARKSPDARRVLFDALVDRYGDNFLDTVAKAQRRADEGNVGEIVLLRTNLLREADDTLVKQRRPLPRSTPPVFSIFPADLRDLRRQEAGEVIVTLVRPRLR